MTIREFYDVTNGDFENVLKRMKTEERVKKYVIMFLKDPSYQELRNAMEENNTENAFRAAHTLKGVYNNLAFTGKEAAAIEITEMLREQKLEEARKLLPTVTEDYQNLIKEIQEIEN
jgi:HPt (histidine-containing phosphotransfer) domain-containing protein